MTPDEKGIEAVAKYLYERTRLGIFTETGYNLPIWGEAGMHSRQRAFFEASEIVRVYCGGLAAGLTEHSVKVGS